jgi:AraC family L-rhamnose operon regulatory protein RhaS
MQTKELLPKVSYVGHYANDKHTLLHMHHGIEIVLVTKGTCINVVRNETFFGKEGTIFVISPETPHVQYNHGFAETFYVVFEQSAINFNPTNRSLDIDDSLVKAWILNLQSLTTDNDTFQASCILGALIERICIFEKKSTEEQELHPALISAIKYIESNFSNYISIEDLAEKACISPSYLNSLFNRQFKLGPQKYLYNFRMKHARQLLHNTYLSVAEAGYKCGFDNPNYFARMFRKTHNCSPSTWRKQQDSWRDNTRLSTF